MLKLIYRIIGKIPLANLFSRPPATFGQAVFGVTQFGDAEGEEEETFRKLKRIFDEADAEHIYHAIRAGCDYFLTLDRTTIVSRAQENAATVASLCPQMQIVTPDILVRELTTPG